MKDSKIDYTQYSFRPEEDLAIKAGAISQIYQVLNELIETEHIGFTLGTDARYEFVHKDTSEVAKPNTKKDKLDKDYKKIFSMAKTLEAPSTIRVTETGKKIFSLMRIIDAARIENLDAGRGTLIETLQAEMQEKQRRLQETIKQQQDAMKALENTNTAEDIGLAPSKKEAPQKEEPKAAPAKKRAPRRKTQKATSK
jgi:hypothetical protein